MYRLFSEKKFWSIGEMARVKHRAHTLLLTRRGGVTVVLSMLGSIAEVILRCMMVAGGYVTNSSTFPQPLSEEEEAKYLARLQQGDEEARAVLIERNLRLVAHIVKKFDNTGEEVDDLISIGTVGLIKAIGTFRPDKGTRLATYAARCIENEMALPIPVRKLLPRAGLFMSAPAAPSPG